MDIKKAKVESILGKVYCLCLLYCVQIYSLYYIIIKPLFTKAYCLSCSKSTSVLNTVSALSFAMPSKTCIKMIQPMNQTVSMDVTMYPLLQCQSSSGSVAKRVILLYHIIVGMKEWECIIH